VCFIEDQIEAVPTVTTKMVVTKKPSGATSYSFEDEVVQAPPVTQGKTFVHVMAHELAHTLGRGHHSGNERALMYHTVTFAEMGYTAMSKEDANAVNPDPLTLYSTTDNGAVYFGDKKFVH
jgi:hypothetical protein